MYSHKTKLIQVTISLLFEIFDFSFFRSWGLNTTKSEKYKILFTRWIIHYIYSFVILINWFAIYTYLNFKKTIIQFACTELTVSVVAFHLENIMHLEN